jgi:hypothetical protein
MNTITIDTETITEDEAIRLYYVLESRFGWKGTFFTRGDAESAWTEYYNQTSEFTDEMWTQVQDSYYWRRALGDNLTEHGWELVNSAVGELPRD